MKRMNLLPPELRPRDGGRRGSSYLVLGALAAAIVAMVAYGAVIHGAHAGESELATLQAETERAQDSADALNPYAEFTDMKDTRARSVRAVAETRFDYERLTRELARILPRGVWVSHLEVTPGGLSAADVEKGADNPDAASRGLPVMSLSGCASSQETVADTLDRLRALTGATDVALGSSGTEGGGGGTGAPATAGGAGEEPYLVASSGGDGGAGGGCGNSGRPRVSFDVTVTLSAPAGEATGS
jgi:Tfp pilus assembly protein PilN